MTLRAARFGNASRIFSARVFSYFFGEGPIACALDLSSFVTAPILRIREITVSAASTFFARVPKSGPLPPLDEKSRAEARPPPTIPKNAATWLGDAERRPSGRR